MKFNQKYDLYYNYILFIYYLRICHQAEVLVDTEKNKLK